MAKYADQLLGQNIDPSFPFDSSTAETYLNDMYAYYQAEPAKPTKPDTVTDILGRISALCDKQDKVLARWLARTEAYEAKIKEREVR